MIWLMEILKIELEEQLLLNYYVIKHLILLKFIDMMNIKEVQLQWFIRFFYKKTAVGAVKNEIMQNKELADELHKPIIKKLKSESTLIFYRLYLGC